jgi:hypothetical protein
VTPFLLVLLLTQAKAGGPYDPDPAHPANRIHRAVHTWSGVAPPYDPGGLHWPDRVYHLSGDSRLALGPLLDELLARKADELLPDPLRRAVLQRDLWMTHDWSEASSRSGEAVQIRVLRPGKDPESHKFVLRRARLFEGKGDGLVPAGPDDLDRAHLLLLGHNKEPGRGIVIRSCLECHTSSSITSLEVVFPVRRPGRASLAPSTREAETDRVHDWCFNRHAFGQLRAAWPE